MDESIISATSENRIRLERKNTCYAKLKTAVLLLLLAIIAVATATVAWFTLNSFASVDDLDLHIGTGAQLLVSTEDHGTDLDLYTKEITNEMINDYLTKYDTDLSKIELDPVTSSDGIKFFNQGGSAKTENSASYLEFPIYFIATKEMYVHLTSDNTSTDKEDGTKVTTTSTGTQADVINCTRVSFDEDNYSKIYEPNKSGAVASQTTFDLQTPMVYSDDTRLFHLNALEPKKIMLRVWIEGEDGECDDDVQSAQLTVALCFGGTDENNESIG